MISKSIAQCTYLKGERKGVVVWRGYYTKFKQNNKKKVLLLPSSNQLFPSKQAPVWVLLFIIPLTVTLWNMYFNSKRERKPLFITINHKTKKEPGLVGLPKCKDMTKLDFKVLQ